MGENVWSFRKRLTLLLGSVVIIAVVFFIFKVLFYYVWPFMLAFCFAVLLFIYSMQANTNNNTPTSEVSHIIS